LTDFVKNREIGICSESNMFQIRDVLTQTNNALPVDFNSKTGSVSLQAVARDSALEREKLPMSGVRRAMTERSRHS